MMHTLITVISRASSHRHSTLTNTPHTHIHTYTHTHVHTYTHSHAHADTRTHTLTRTGNTHDICTYTHTCTHSYTQTQSHTLTPHLSLLYQHIHPSLAPSLAAVHSTATSPPTAVPHPSRLSRSFLPLLPIPPYFLSHSPDRPIPLSFLFPSFPLPRLLTESSTSPLPPPSLP
jgi:hypothetical protein